MQFSITVNSSTSRLLTKGIHLEIVDLDKAHQNESQSVIAGARRSSMTRAPYPNYREKGVRSVPGPYESAHAVLDIGSALTENNLLVDWPTIRKQSKAVELDVGKFTKFACVLKICISKDFISFK